MNRTDSLQGIRRIHLVGIGGIGVSALAPVLKARGFAVSGSDREKNSITERLQKQGIPIHYEHNADNVQGVDLLVVSSAIPADNPELVAAQTAGVPVWPRAKMLGQLMREEAPHGVQTGIVITGSHGKTTLSAMLTQVLVDVGEDPSVFIGGEFATIGGNVRMGQGEWVIAEGDESDGSFVHLKPRVAVINNIDEDHLDYYQSLEAICKQFRLFISNIPEDGFVVYSADCEHCRDLLRGLGATPLSYGFSESADIQGRGYRRTDSGWACDVFIRGKKAGTITLRQPGRMTMHNALGAAAVCDLTAIPFAYIVRSLFDYPGVNRRMEIKGREAGVLVIDDYAHHPAEVRATVQALREHYEGRLIGVFQPHLYSRTQKLAHEFGPAFDGLDMLILTDVYPAREDPIPGVSGELLIEPAEAAGVDVIYLDELGEIAEALAQYVQRGDVVVTLGAGSVGQVSEALLNLLKRREVRDAS